MNDYQVWSLIISGVGVIVTLIVIIVAIFGERIRQLWRSPLDPNSVTSEVFHCFSSGIIFRDKDLNSIIPFYQNECSLEFPYIFNPALFVKLDSKEKLSRTVILRGYPDIPS